MRLPEIRPLRDVPATDVGLLRSNASVQAFIDRANSQYMDWEKIRHEKLPAGLAPETAWRLVQLSRSNRRMLPLKSLDGQAFSYWLPNAMWGQLHEIDKRAGAEISNDPDLLHDKHYLVNSLMEEAIASSQIEGASTTRAAAKEMLRTRRRPRNRAERMILNNYVTIEQMNEYVKRPLSIKLLCEIQASMTRDTLDDGGSLGRLRQESENDIAVYAEDGTLLHQPPPAETLPDRLRIMCEYANRITDAEDGGFEHPVVTAMALHFWLGYEHPFVDGNGRTARALFHWYLLKRGYWLFRYLWVSRVILRSSGKYRDAFLLAERDEGDLGYFFSYHLRAARISLDQFYKYIGEKRDAISVTFRSMAASALLNEREKPLVLHALKHSGFIYTARSHQASNGVSMQTAHNDLEHLSRVGLLEKVRQGRRDVWIAPPDLEKRLKELELPRKSARKA